MLGPGLWISTKASDARSGRPAGDGDVSAVDLPVGLRLPARFDALASAAGRAVCIPATWLIDASRGVILRGGGWQELWQHALVLWGMAIGMLDFQLAAAAEKARIGTVFDAITGAHGDIPPSTGFRPRW